MLVSVTVLDAGIVLCTAATYAAPNAVVSVNEALTVCDTESATAAKVGSDDGVGLFGPCVGVFVWLGRGVGAIDGVVDGLCVGVAVGTADGTAVGGCVGVAVGVAVGTTVGVAVGTKVGTTVGAAVGANVGAKLPATTVTPTTATARDVLSAAATRSANVTLVVDGADVAFRAFRAIATVCCVRSSCQRPAAAVTGAPLNSVTPPSVTLNEVGAATAPVSSDTHMRT